MQFFTPTDKDLPRLAQCHRAAFPGTLSTAMGQHYVEKMLEWYLIDDRAFIFLLEEDNICVGYCGGMKSDSSARAGSASSMIQHSYNQAVKTFIKRPWLFLHPEFFPKYRLALRNVLKRIRKGLGYDEKVAPIKNLQRQEPHTGLVVIGVHQNVQGKGYGSKLLQEFERVSKDLGVCKMMLTVKSDNEQAIKSYLRNGWIVSKVEGKSTYMEKQLK
jgi:ribosomal protein S18 acetylase RimI-like enzyme